MKAILVCREKSGCWVRKSFPGMSPYVLKILNKPLLEYFIDFCVLMGVRQIRIVQDDPAPDVEGALGDGRRWGVELSYLPVREEDEIPTILAKNRAFCRGGSLLCMEGFFFPRCDMRNLPPVAEAEGMRSFSLTSPVHKGRILLLSEGDSLEQCRERDDWPGLSLEDMQSVADYFRISMEILHERSSHYSLPGYNSEEGVYIGQNVEISPNVQILKPVMIGDQVQLVGRATIGPSAVIGGNVIVDDATLIQDSIVGDHTYVGAGLEFRDKIVFKNRIITASTGDTLKTEEKFIVSGMEEKFFRQLARSVVHLILAVWLILLQIVPYTVLRLLLGVSPRIVRRKREYLVSKSGKTISITTLETTRPSILYGLYRRLSLDKFPLVLRVLRGDLFLAGQTLREKTAASTAFVRDLFLYQPAAFTYPESLSFSQQDPADADIHDRYYSANPRIGMDVKIIMLSIFNRLFSS